MENQPGIVIPNILPFGTDMLGKLPPGATPPGASPRLPPDATPTSAKNNTSKYMAVLREYPLIQELLLSVFDECKKKDARLTPAKFFTYDYKIPDPFLEYEPAGTLHNPNLGNLYELYMSINPNYKPISDLPTKKLQFPFYKYVVAGMAKDLVVARIVNKYPNNSKKLKTIVKIYENKLNLHKPSIQVHRFI